MLTKKDIRYLYKAKRIADISDFEKQNIGCVAVYKGDIISVGYNSNRTHPMQKYYNKYREIKYKQDEMLPKLHAEINCLNSIKMLDIDFSRVKLYIYRKRRDQEYGLARPCPSCMRAIMDLGILDIYYTTNYGFCHEKVNNKGVA